MLKKYFLHYRVLSILFLGFSAGIPLALIGATLSMWLARLGIDVKTIGLFALVSVPFSFKYLWSSVFDYVAIPYFSKKYGLRKSWLIASQVMLILAIMALGSTSPSDNITLTAVFALLVAFCSATQDIVIDALRIEVLKQEEQGLGATLYVYGYRTAMLVSGAGALLLADHIPWNLVFYVMSLGIAVGIVAVIFMKEPELAKDRLAKLASPKWSLTKFVKFIFTRKWLPLIAFIVGGYLLLDHFQVPSYIKFALGLCLAGFIYYQKRAINILPEPIKDFCKRPLWLHILLFIVFYKFADTLLISLQSKFYVDMGFSNSEIAYITKGFGFFMTLAGLAAGGFLYYRMGVFKSLLIAGILQILSNLVFIWIYYAQHDLVVLSAAIAVENFTGAISNVVIVAYLSSLCNIAYTATQYALLSSVSTIGRTVLAAPAGYLVASFGWVKFFVITALAGIPGIILLCMIFRKGIHHEKK